MSQIEPKLTRFLQRMEAVPAFMSMRCFDAPNLLNAMALTAEKASAIDFDVAQSALNGPGWYDSSWDLLRGLRVQETTAAGAGRLDDWAQCLFA